MSDGAAYFRLHYGLLEELLRIPTGHKIKRVSGDFSGFDDCVVVIVEGPDFPPCELGTPLPNVCPKYEKKSDGTVSFAGWK
jgi:hypothetical protein